VFRLGWNHLSVKLTVGGLVHGLPDEAGAYLTIDFPVGRPYRWNSRKFRQRTCVEVNLVIEMDAFNRKLFRDLWLMRGSVVAIVLVIAAGVATYVMARCALESLKRAQSDYYAQFRFAQIFVHMERAPQSLEQRIAAIPGVDQVQTRIVVHAKVDLPDFVEPATAKLISIPDNSLPNLNRLHLRNGRYPTPGVTGEVLVSEGFASVHSLLPGDGVRAIINGRFRQLTVVGVALSPEYIFQIREGDVLPDDRRYGVFWIGRSELAAAFDLQGAFNDVACSLVPGAIEADVIQRLDQLTVPYGGVGAIGRADQSSHRFVTNEMQELRGMALVVPTIFLAISAFLLNMVVLRLVATQREQIAALKAFGYTNPEVAWHYIKLVTLILGQGVILGIAAGAYFGHHITRLYSHFFHFPVFNFYLAPTVLLSACFVSIVSAFSGTLSAVWRVVSLSPAAAMRPASPTTFGPSSLERMGFGRYLSAPMKLVLRKLERHPIRSLLTCLGISLAVAVLILGSFMLDAVDYAIQAQYSVAMREDISVVLTEHSSSNALHAIRSLPGVRWCEPFRAISTRLRNRSHVRRVEVLGMDSKPELHRLMDIDSHSIVLPPTGIVLSEKLGQVLELQVGDTLHLEVLEGKRPQIDLPVVGLIKDFAGTAAYMHRDAMNRIMGEGSIVSGAFVAADSSRIDQLFRDLKQAPRVASVLIKGSTMRSFRDTVGENLLRMRSSIVIFASVIAVGVVFNSARIAFDERSRELATLRVIGFTRAETSFLLFGELAIITTFAIPLGLIFGYGLAFLVIRFSYDTELFRMPLVVNRSTYGFAAVVTVAATIGSTLIVRRMLDQLDLVAVLKAKE